MAQAASSCVRASAARRRPRTDRSLPFDFDVFLHTPLATVQDPCYHYVPLSAEYAPMWATSVCWRTQSERSGVQGTAAFVNWINTAGPSAAAPLQPPLQYFVQILDPLQ